MATLLVNIAQMKISSGADIFNATGLGSCMGVVLYDPIKKVGGMIHVLLPCAEEGAASNQPMNPTKFADPGIKHLYDAVIKAGANPANLYAKMAGGASMLSFNSRVGERNAEHSERMLNQLKVKILAKDIGGNSGRTVTFDVQTGVMTVSTLNKGKYTI